MKDPNNWEYIILVEFVKGKGDILPNMLILSGKQYLEKYFEKNDLENNVCFAVSDSGYSNNGIGVRWLEHFSKGAWRMLIMDRASCYTNEKFVRVCYSKNILLFQLPSHSTYLLQALDVVCF